MMVGAIPPAYGWNGGEVLARDLFRDGARRARGSARSRLRARQASRPGVPAQEMTKWFDTNYHYMVPEFARGQAFELASLKPVDEFREAKALGYHTRPVLLGPVTFLKLGKSKDAALDPLSLLGGLLPVYIDVLRRLAANGAEWVQLDEPCLVLDLDDATRDALRYAYASIARALPSLKIMLTSYFGGLGGNLDTALSLPVAGLHVDLVRAPDQLDTVAGEGAAGAGAVARRYRRPQCLARRSAGAARPAGAGGRRSAAPIMCRSRRPARCCMCRSISTLERDLDPDLKSWLAFAVQKMGELATLGKALAGGRGVGARGARGIGRRGGRAQDVAEGA